MGDIIQVLILCFLSLYILGLIIKDNSKIDIFWGLGFVLLVWGMFTSQEFLSISHYAVSILITLWGFRLAYNISKKHLKHPGEDFRYATWRKTWKSFYIRSFLQIYVLQFILMLIVGIPILFMYREITHESSVILFIGIFISSFGLIYETVADKQLANFIQIRKKGEILTSGLRKYHRYPQYFGESVFWFGISTIASQVSILAFMGWIMITLLVRYVSGVPMLEARYKGDKKYQKYSEKTNIFIPDWFLCLLKRFNI